MQASQMFLASKFIRRDEIATGEVRARIADLIRVQYGPGDADQAWALAFEGTEQLLLLTSELISELTRLFGADVVDWRYQEVVLFVEAKSFKLAAPKRGVAQPFRPLRHRLRLVS